MSKNALDKVGHLFVHVCNAVARTKRQCTAPVRWTLSCDLPIEIERLELTGWKQARPAWALAGHYMHIDVLTLHSFI